MLGNFLFFGLFIYIFENYRFFNLTLLNKVKKDKQGKKEKKKTHTHTKREVELILSSFLELSANVERQALLNIV